MRKDKQQNTMPREILKKYFGYDAFRPLQEEVITAIYEGRDCLVIMPTGSGKSLCYQIPAIGLPGTAIVVSPLISLMKDQVDALRTAGVKAAYLNSSLEYAEQRRVENDFLDGKLDLLYVSPEKISASNGFGFFHRAKINLFAIDEAHCISTWGHDFRPDYKTLQGIKEKFPGIPVVALTATADRVTRRDIAQLLRLHEPAKFIASFDRPNIYLEARPGQQRIPQIISFIENRPNEAGIVYCLSKKSTEQLADKLRKRGIKAEHYHAGMNPEDRSKVQEAFLKDEISVVCATVAFGMGIDKSNVRWVIHYNMPKNIEGYYQEIGRSGRDGLPAHALLFYSYADIRVWREIISEIENREFAEIQTNKLERMMQFAEAVSCRRRILLTYFNEDKAENCGHCDICKNPPRHVDGTLIAQKALSAVYRLKESVGLNMLIDVLRGSQRRDIFLNNYHLIKTYGKGKDLSFEQWKNYLRQLINLGYLEMAPDEKMVLKLTPASNRVLFEKEQVQLVDMQTAREHLAREKAAAKARQKSPRQRARNQLFEHLRELRMKLAREKGVPPYVIFSDASLEEMAAKAPTSLEAFANIAGVGEMKLKTYGPVFVQAIEEFIAQTGFIPSPPTAEPIVAPMSELKKPSAEITLELYQQGLSLHEIAEKRGLQPTTIFSHFTQLIQNGEHIDTSDLISEEETQKIIAAQEQLQASKLKELFEHFNEKIPYGKLRLALALKERREGVGL